MIESGWYTRLSLILRREEGDVRFAYDDLTALEVKAPMGNLTIGIGHNLQANGLSDAARAFILKEDVCMCVLDARHTFHPEVFESFPEPCKTAIVSLIFQLGYTKFQQFVPTIELMREQRWNEAADRLERSLWADQLRRLKSKRLDRTLMMLRECKYHEDYKIDSFDPPAGSSGAGSNP